MSERLDEAQLAPASGAPTHGAPWVGARLAWGLDQALLTTALMGGADWLLGAFGARSVFVQHGTARLTLVGPLSSGEDVICPWY